MKLKAIPLGSEWLRTASETFGKFHRSQKFRLLFPVLQENNVATLDNKRFQPPLPESEEPLHRQMLRPAKYRTLRIVSLDE